MAKRLLRYEAELFEFVRVDGVAATNNLTARSVHPLVIARTSSDGSRSAASSDAYMAVASLFETWQARKLNPFDECLTPLSQTARPQV